MTVDVERMTVERSLNERMEFVERMRGQLSLSMTVL